METMKSMFFACALLLGSAETFSAENLVLSEDFESQTFPPSGWVVKGTELSEDLESGYAQMRRCLLLFGVTLHRL